MSETIESMEMEAFRLLELSKKPNGSPMTSLAAIQRRRLAWKIQNWVRDIRKAAQ